MATKRTREDVLTEQAEIAGAFRIISSPPFDTNALPMVDKDAQVGDLQAEVERGEPEQVIASEAHVQFLVGDAAQGSGTVFVGTRSFYWWSEEKQRGFAIDHKRIIMHAIASDPAQFGAACIYCQLDAGDADKEEEEEEEANQDRRLADATECRIIPDSSDKLNAIYNALTTGSSINPDEAEEDDEEGFMFGMDDEGALSSHGQSVLAHLNAALENGEEDGEDDDADDAEENGNSDS